MASYIDKCSNEKLGVNHKTRVVQELSERIKKKFEMLSSNSCTAALWKTYHGFICLIKDFIRAEQLHDFELHFAIVAKMCLSLQQQVEVSTPKFYGCILSRLQYLRFSMGH